MADMHQVFERMIAADDLTCIDRLDLPGRPSRLATIPQHFRSGAPGKWLTNDPQLKGKLWLHQAKALRAVAGGKNVIVATGTASGKSLIFQSAALRLLDTDNDAKVLVFYPLKALANDQLLSWRSAIKMAGLRGSTVDKIDGSVPRQERSHLLRSRIVLMTPDVCHAWLMQEISNPVHQDFVSEIALIVIDEAHTLEGVFGSNFAYLFRRLCAARYRILRSQRKKRSLQIVAASATIRDPDKHLHNVTGLHYVTIDDSDNGAPQAEHTIVHIQAPNPSSAYKALLRRYGTILRRLVDESDGDSCIMFIDSRQRAELISKYADDRRRIEAYRAGYMPEDRAAIEGGLRDGSIRGVVATPALELGIDIPHFSVGLNVGVPQSRKSFRQRVGRVGREGRGIFAIIAPSYAFSRFGTTLLDYYQGSVEPSYLYLHNRFVQYAHARCLTDELEMLGDSGRKRVPGRVSWPDGFGEKLDFAYTGAPSDRPREYDQIDDLGGDQPHFNYRLRSIEEQFTVGVGGPAGSIRRIEDLTKQQAVREAFPGAVFWHRKSWLVYEWRRYNFEPTIRVAPTKSLKDRRPLLRTFVNVSLDSIVERHHRSSDLGYLAECHLRITERVEGYREGDRRFLYKDLRQKKRGMTPKTRDFRTTGVVLRVNESWFSEKGVKDTVANALLDLTQREYSISPNDAGCVATNVSEIRGGRRQTVTDAIVIYDSTHGSLRLTEPVYAKFDQLLQLLNRSAEMTAPSEQLLSREVIRRLGGWFDRLKDTTESKPADLRATDEVDPTGWQQVFEVGSVVAYRDSKGELCYITITGRQLMQMGDRLHLGYTYQRDGITASIPAERVEGDEWDKVYWNPKTNESRDSLEESPTDNTHQDLGTSPYIVGNPVDQDQERMFFGRATVMDRIKRQLGGSNHANVVLLEGNRRTGKTSILRQLGKKDALAGWIPVYCSLQDVDSVATKDVFRLLALRTGWTLADIGIETWVPDLPRPDAGKSFKLAFRAALSHAIDGGHPFEMLELYLSTVANLIKPKRLLLMLDEFDKLQEGIDEGITSPQVPENIRHLLQHLTGLGAIITGSRRLKRLREEYWSALFGLGYRIGVSALPRAEARRLVTEPVYGKLEYDPTASDHVVDLCACHPFLVQSLCSRVFDQAATGATRVITLDIVEQAAEEMVRDNEHFHTLWGYAGSERRRLILALCAAGTSGSYAVSLERLKAKLQENGASHFTDNDLIEDITELRELELLDYDESSGGTYRPSVPLMAMWIETNVDFEALRMRALRENSR